MIKKILSTILILLSLVLVFKGDALAKGLVPSFGEDITVGTNEVLEGPYLKTGDNITISGTINGDAYLLGSFVTVDGMINGDLIVGGGTVHIKGKVSDDVRTAGGIVTIDGKVGKNVTALGGTVTFGSDAAIGGDVIVVGQNFAHLGNINGKAQIYTTNVTLAGRVGGNTEAKAEEVNVAKTAILDGNLSYTSDKEASVSAEAKIAGAVKRTPITTALTRVVPKRGVFFRFRLLSYFSMLLLGVILLRIAPRQVTAAAKLIGEQPWRSMGLGFLALVLTPIAAVILMISVIGVPLAAILAVAYILMIWLSSIFAGLFVGQKVFDWANLKENRYATMAIGLLLLQLVFAIPTVGGFIRLLSILSAVGAMIILKREALRRLEARS